MLRVAENTKTATFHCRNQLLLTAMLYSCIQVGEMCLISVLKGMLSHTRKHTVTQKEMRRVPTDGQQKPWQKDGIKNQQEM